MIQTRLLIEKKACQIQLLSRTPPLAERIPTPKRATRIQIQKHEAHERTRTRATHTPTTRREAPFFQCRRVIFTNWKKCLSGVIFTKK